jgi:hypothetical protein
VIGCGASLLLTLALMLTIGPMLGLAAFSAESCPIATAVLTANIPAHLRIAM